MRWMALLAVLAAGCTHWERNGKNENSVEFQNSAEVCADTIARRLGCKTYETCGQDPVTGKFRVDHSGTDSMRMMRDCLQANQWRLK